MARLLLASGDMSIQHTTTTYPWQQPKDVQTSLTPNTPGVSSFQHSQIELITALLDPCLTVGEATLHALIQRHHPPNRPG